MNKSVGEVRSWILALAAGGICAGVVAVLLAMETKWLVVGLVGLTVAVAAIVSGNPSRFFLVLLAWSVPLSAVSHTFLKREEFSALATSGIAFGIIDALILLLYAIWFFRLMVGKGERIKIISKPNMLALGFILLSSFSLINSIDRTLSIFELIRMMKVYFLFFYLANAVSAADLAYVAAGLLLGVFMQSGIGVAQYLTNSTLGMGMLGGAVENMSIIMGNKEDFRVAGTILHPNQYALYLSSLLPLAFSLLLCIQQKTWARLMAGAVFALGIVGLLFSFSRTGWICLAVGVVAVLLVLFCLGRMTSKQVFVLTLTGTTGILIALAFSRQIMDRMLASDPEAISIRRDLLRLAWAMIRRHPFLGNGLNNFVSLQFRWDPIGVSIVRSVHNLYALIWAETGFFTLLIFLGFLAALFARLQRPIRSSDNLVQGMALGIGTGLLVFAVDGLTDYSYRMEVGHTLFWFLAGLIVALYRISGFTGKEPYPAALKSEGVWGESEAILPQEG